MQIGRAASVHTRPGSHLEVDCEDMRIHEGSFLEVHVLPPPSVSLFWSAPLLLRFRSRLPQMNAAADHTDLSPAHALLKNYPRVSACPRSLLPRVILAAHRVGRCVRGLVTESSWLTRLMVNARSHGLWDSSCGHGLWSRLTRHGRSY